MGPALGSTKHWQNYVVDFFSDAPAQQGAIGLIAMVALFVLGVLISVWVQMMNTRRQSMESILLRGEVEVIRRTVLNNFHCNATLAAMGSCTQNIQVLRAAGNVFIPTTGLQLGSFRLRGYCRQNSTTGSNEIGVEMARLPADKSISSTDFLKEPLTGESMSWNSSSTQIFTDGIAPCRSLAGAGQPTVFSNSNLQGQSQFIVPANVPRILIEIWGAGGGGGAGREGDPAVPDDEARGGGGGGGSYASVIRTVNAGETYTITVGAAGSGGSCGAGGGANNNGMSVGTGNPDGGNGGDTMITFKGLEIARAQGGRGGLQGSPNPMDDTAGTGGMLPLAPSSTQAGEFLGMPGGSGFAGWGQNRGPGYGGNSPIGGFGGKPPGRSGDAPGGGGMGGEIPTAANGCSPGFSGADGRVIIWTI
jgi:hypothetical protein